MGAGQKLARSAPSLPRTSLTPRLPQLRRWRDSTFPTPPLPPRVLGRGRRVRTRLGSDPGGHLRSPGTLPSASPRSGKTPGRPRVAGSELSHRNAGVWMRARGRGFGLRSPSKPNPASFQLATVSRSQAPRPNLSPRATGPSPPLCPPGPPLTAGPAGAAPRHRRSPSPRGCRSLCSGPLGHPRALPCSAEPVGAGRAQGAAPAAMASSRALPAASGPVLLPGRAGGRRRRWLPLGLLPRPRRGAGVGLEMGGEAGASWRGERSHGRSGGAVPPAAGGSDTAAGAPWCSGLPAPRGSVGSRRGSQDPNVRGWNPRVLTLPARTPRIGTRGGSHSPQAGLVRAAGTSELPALCARVRGWALPGPAGP